MWSLKTAHLKTDTLSTRIISIFLLPVRYLLLFMRIRFFWRDRKKNTFSAEKRNCDFLSRKVFCFYYLAQLFLLLSFFWSTRVLKRPRHPFCPKTGKYRHRLYLNLPIKFMRTKKAQRGRGYLDFLGGGACYKRFWSRPSPLWYLCIRKWRAMVAIYSSTTGQVRILVLFILPPVTTVSKAL